jgi:hypothetical protein
MKPPVIAAAMAGITRASTNVTATRIAIATARN